MKNSINNTVFASQVKLKVEQAEAMGTKTSWDTRDHLKALAMAVSENAAAVVAKATDPEHDAEYVETIKAAILIAAVEILEDGYNISGFAQMLEKIPAFAAKGHFQRAGKGKPATTNEFYQKLGIT